jgi:hypothetical protein
MKDLGCDYLQGYVYSKALNVQEFSDKFIKKITVMPIDLYAILLQGVFCLPVALKELSVNRTLAPRVVFFDRHILYKMNHSVEKSMS